MSRNTKTLLKYPHYYPFGLMMPGRSWSEGYRFGFNGKELDAEGLGGNGSTYDYGFRIYNPAIAKFLSVDPLTASYPWYTPYQFAGNKPIIADDLDGLEERIRIHYSAMVEDKQGKIVNYQYVEEIVSNNAFDLGNGMLNINYNLLVDQKTNFESTFALEYLGKDENTGEYNLNPELLAEGSTSGNIAFDRFFSLQAKETNHRGDGNQGGLILTSANGPGVNERFNKYGRGQFVDFDGLIGLLNGASAFQTSKPENLAETIKTISEAAVHVANMYELKEERQNVFSTKRIPFDTVCADCKKPGKHYDSPQISRDVDGNAIDTLNK